VKVYQAINAVQSALSKDGIGKDRNNQAQGYKFRGIDDVFNALSPLLAKHGLCILPRCTERICVERTNAKGTALFYVTVCAEFDFVSSEDGSKHTVTTYGEAMDSGDKATNKAMSAAYKYAAMQAFSIPTEGDNDADATTHEVAASKPRATAAKPANEPAPDMSPKARAQRIMTGVSAGDAAGAAEAMAGWDTPLLNAVWALLDQTSQDKLTAAWPKAA
jgi:hypothetical protein